MALGGGSRLCFCFLLCLLVVCSARNTILLSEEETAAAGIEGRSLKVKLDDYSAASANTGHDPGRRVIGRPRKL